MNQIYNANTSLKVIAELEKALKFKYLAHIEFENPGDREDVKQRGMKKLETNQIGVETQELGMRLRAQIENPQMSLTSIRWVNEQVGFGLFAEEPLEADSYFGEYTGIVRKNDRRYFEPLNNYCYEYPVPDDIGRHFVIDATQGNFTRFINHSREPNLKPVHVFLEGFYHLVFLTLRSIQKDEQLLYNYGQSYWNIRQRPISLNKPLT